MKYGLYVYCRRVGVTRDSGLHATIEAQDEKAAGRELVRELAWLRQFYDEISYQILPIENDKAAQ